MATLSGSYHVLRYPARLIHHPSLILARALCSALPSEWAGLEAWRASPVDERRALKHPSSKSREPHPASIEQHTFPVLHSAPASLAEWGALALNTADPLAKACITHHAFRLWSDGTMPVGAVNAPDRPARPLKPPLVPMKGVPDLKNSPLPRNAHVLHNLAHIELNAVDLAWDTVVRFSGASQLLSQQFFADFVHVADDESRHFGWCSQRLTELGFCYGDMPAHDVLMSEGQKSASNVLARLAVVPMVQEARGLDAGPRLAARLVGWGDTRSSRIVNQIAEEEIAHVAVGVSWFLAVCKKMNRAPDSTFKELLQEFNVEMRGPYNHIARARAGIPRNWYDASAELLIEPDENRCHQKSSSGSTEREEVYDKVYDRLALLVGMEKESAAL